MQIDRLLHYWPIVLALVAVISAASIGQFQISAHAEEMDDLSESVDENEEAIEVIQRLLIRRQGEVENQVQRIELEQKQISEDVDEILQLLRRSISNQ